MELSHDDLSPYPYKWTAPVELIEKKLWQVVILYDNLEGHGCLMTISRDLSYNNFTGPVPDILAELPFLEVL